MDQEDITHCLKELSLALIQPKASKCRLSWTDSSSVQKVRLAQLNLHARQFH